MYSSSELAIFGGERNVRERDPRVFAWPIVTEEHERAVLSVLHRGAMSAIDVTCRFEDEFANWIGRDHALAFNNGTAALHAAMFGCGVGVGDEVICPSVTYWASIVQCFSLGATPVFADIDPVTICIDPKDIEHRITPKTRAIMVVHYMGYPVDMDPVMEIAERHGLKVIEDVSHAQGGLYKGRVVGTIGHVAGISLMSAKSFSVGEGGMLVTDDLEIYERAVAFGHYERFNDSINTEDIKPFQGVPMGGYKYRMHQLSSAMGRVQLKYYDRQCAEIQQALNYFWDLLEGTPGIRPHRTEKGSGSTMGGWYAPHGLYVPDELGGLSVSRFTEAVRAEGVEDCLAGCNAPLHLHPLFNTCDIYGHGRPTRIANSNRDLRQSAGSLPVSERINRLTFAVPPFKRFAPEVVEQYAAAYKKVASRYDDLLEGDTGDPVQVGGWHFFKAKESVLETCESI